MIRTILLTFLLTICTFISAQKIHLSEDFNSGTLPTGWTNNAVTGSTLWQFGLVGSTAATGSSNLNGTSFAYFDDDNLGNTALNNTVELLTPVFDNSADSATTLKFDYNFRQFGSSVTDAFSVDVFDGINWINVFSRSINDCGNYTSTICINNFPHAVVDISAYANPNCQVRFTYHDGNDWAWYVGIDNVEITSPFDNDVLVSEIINPTSGCGLTSSETIAVKVKNIGTMPANGFDVIFNLDNGAQTYTETITNPIAAGDSLNYTFTATANMSSIKTYSANSYTNLTTDGNILNDSTNRSIENEPAFTPTFIDDFESSYLWEIQGVNPSWELGTPTNTIINSTTSGTKAYVTDLDGMYNSSELSYLVSPCFDFSGDTIDPIVSFDLIYRTETAFDFLTFESSIDNGANWQTVNTGVNAINWYNSFGFWDGNSNGWIPVENRLTGLNGQSQVLFRFKFQSDASGNFEGVGIDNFSIRHQDLTDLNLTTLLFPSTSISPLCGLSNNSNIIVAVQNKGVNQVDTTFFFYTINNGSVFSDTLFAPILPDSTISFTFQQQFNFSSASSYTIDTWLSTPGDGFALNDSLLNRVLTNPTTQIESLPYFEDFESFPFGIGLAGGWTQPASNSIWAVVSGSTASFGSGPRNNHTSGGINYIYTEASAVNGLIAILESPCIDLGTVNAARLEFWSHRFGRDMVDLFIDVYDGNQWVNIDIITNTPQTADSSAYTLNSLNISTFKGRTVKIRFRTSAFTGFGSDMAIDDISIFEPLPNDIQVNQLISPTSGCTPNGQVTVELENFGSSDITLPFPITLQVNNGPIVTETVNLPFLIGEKKNFTFNSLANFSTINTTYTIDVITFLNGDPNPQNDSLKTQIINSTQPLTYAEGFSSFIDGECPSTFVIPSNDLDSLKLGWEVTTISGNSEWQVHDVGLCGGGTNNGTSTGPNVDNSPSGTGKFMYVESSNGTSITQLSTPCIDFSNVQKGGMKFWYHALGPDIGALTIDVFANGVWDTVPGFSIVGQQQTLQSDPWRLATVQLDQFVGQMINVRFNYSFIGGLTTGTGDFAIDDVSFFDGITNINEEENQKHDFFTIYPNPNKGNFNLEITQQMVGKVYQIINIKGSIVKEFIISSVLSTIELNAFEKGIYFLRIEGETETKKIVIY